MPSDRRPILCLITDRRRLCAADDEHVRIHGLLAQVREAIGAGVDLIQIREPDLEARALTALVSEAVAAARGSSTRIVVNDRLDVALASGAHGVHLRGDSMPASATRSIAPRGFIIGRSVHDEADARRVAPDVDYLVAGTVFPTASKPDRDRWLGEDGLADVVRAVRVPVLAIGGVTLDRLFTIAATGAAGIAAIGLFIGGPLGAIVDRTRAVFDSVKTAP